MYKTGTALPNSTGPSNRPGNENPQRSGTTCQASPRTTAPISWQAKPGNFLPDSTSRTAISTQMDQSWRMAAPSPNLTAELTAILAALQVLDMTKSPPKTVAILSDPRSSLDILFREYCKSRPELLSII